MAALAAFAHLVLVPGGIVCAEQPRSAKDHANKATELVEAGNFQEAESELRSGVHLAPGDASYLASFGTPLAMQRKFEESTSIFKQALKIRPSEGHRVGRRHAYRQGPAEGFPIAEHGL
jgi:Flp pilus assembly protein TadD